MLKMKMLGVKSMQGKLLEFSKQFPKRMGAALYLEAEVAMTEAKKRTPVDVNYTGGRKPPHPGQLRASGVVHPPEYKGEDVSVTLSFGNAEVDYAVWVHEILDNYHPVGQAKYLESVLNESRTDMLQRLGRKLKL